MPSAFALLAAPARLGCWTRSQLVQVLRFPREPVCGWGVVAEVAPHLGKDLHRRTQTIRLGAQLIRWIPTCLRPLLGDHDATTHAQLRFCESCLSGGFHSPLFQLPWWDTCPVHDEPLRTGCPSCGNPLRAGLAVSSPSQWLICGQCGFELSDPGRLVRLPLSATRRCETAKWWGVLGDYFRWSRATDAAEWTLPWRVVGEGQFDDIARVAARKLAQVIGPPPALRRHLVDQGARGSSRAWSRQFNESLATPSPRALGFTTPAQMRETGRRFYGALPIPRECRKAIDASDRHIRRKVGVRLRGTEAPGSSGENEYLWTGPRPLVVLGYRLLTSLACTDRVGGIDFLDFPAIELVREPPAVLAQELLAAWTGVDLGAQRVWPTERIQVFIDQHLAMRSRFRDGLASRKDRMPHGALRWLYTRTVLEAWHDIALESLSRMRFCGVAAWRLQQAPCSRGTGVRLVSTQVLIKRADPKEASHPLLVHARADRLHPRGWAAAILRIGDEGNKGKFVAFFGRSGPKPFLGCLSSWSARWEWPDETIAAAGDSARTSA